MEFRTLTELLAAVLGAQPDPPLWMVPVTGVLALAVVLYAPAWRIARNVITIVHEAGHAGVALLTGRRLHGVTLHSDTSGLTVSVGRPTGPGMIVTVLAGYTAPPLLGLGYAGILAVDRVTLLLWLSIALLALLLVAIRNLYGGFAVLATGGLVFVVSWFGSATVQSGFAYFMTWFLLVGGVWPVLELQRRRRRRRGYGALDSDADQLARLTGVAGTVWVVGFGAFALAAAVLGGRWLLL